MQLTTVIDATPDDVWAVLVDLDEHPTTLGAVLGVERIAGPDFGVGTRWRETRQIFGRARAEEMEVVGMDRGRWVVIGSEGGGARYRTRFAVAPLGSISELSVSFDVQATNRVAAAVGLVTGRLLSTVTRRALRSDLADIRRAAQDRSAARDD